LHGFKKPEQDLRMSSNDIAIRVANLGKRYEIYSNPLDRLRQFIVPKLKRLLGQVASQYFREFWALHDVSFEVRKGETIGIIGRNGSGKSTLLQIICGTLTPTYGDIEVYGRVAALLELGSGFNPEFTGRENVYLNAAVLGLSKNEIESRFRAIVDFADIGDFIEQPVKTYSSGMMVRLAFAVIAHVDADILVIDEALAVGDAFFTQKCMRFLRQFMKTGTVLFVSHDTGSVKSLCSRALWLEKGEIVLQGEPKELCEKYLEAFYEAQQGVSTTTKFRAIAEDVDEQSKPLVDQRLEFINQSNLRNDLKIFSFDPEASSFGLGGAQICDVALLDGEEHNLAWIVGGELVTLRVKIHANQHLRSPIIGFFVRDKLGQNLFGDNTYLLYRESNISCAENQRILVDFNFQMPILPVGSYSITVAVADGTQDDHLQHHWIHDAITFKSESSSVTSGLMGVPMQKILLSIE
jgi:lipopolysaccharide transport system ATP-binding protein